MLNRKQKEIVRLLQGDIPLERRPFAQLAEQLSLDEEELLEELRHLQKEGYLRRVGAILYHRRAGFTHNAMVAWKVEEEKIEEVGKRMASSPHTTHVYQRVTHPEWPYNLYTMIHGGSREECQKIAAELSRDTGRDDYLLLFSTREFKKSSMRYF